PRSTPFGTRRQRQMCIRDRNWTQLSLGIGLNDVIFKVTIDPNNSNTIWAGVDDAMGAQPINVIRSTNGGTSWANMTPPMSPLACRSIAVRPGDSNSVYACFGGSFGGGAVWVTTNGGGSWVNRSAGLPGNPMMDVVHDGSRVLVGGGMLFGSQYVGLYASTNNGASWTDLSGGWPNLYVRDIEIDPTNSSVLLAGTDGDGVFRSTNGGVSWSFGIGGSGSFSVRSVRFAPASASRILLGLGSLGVYQSEDGGATFVPSSNGIMALDVYSVAASPVDPLEIAIAYQGQNDGGVYRSTDGGESWGLEAVPPTRYSHVGFAYDGTLYAISSGPSSVAPEGLYRRNPDGTWTGLGPDQGDLYESDLTSLCFSRQAPGTILAGGADFGVAGFQATVWLTTDGGTNWKKAYESIESETVEDIERVDDGTDQIAVAAFADFSQNTGGALRTTDGGLHWFDSSAGLHPGARGMSLSVLRGDPQTLYYADGNYAAGAGGVYRTTNGGVSWASAGYAGTGSVWSVLCDPNDANNVWITRPDPEKVMLSTNGGASFSAWNAGLASSGYARGLAHSGGSEPRVLLSTSTGTWTSALPPLAGLGEEAWNGSDDSSLRAFPNPATGSSPRILFRMPRGTEEATITIVDPAGRIVRMLASGNGEAVWDGRMETGELAPSGVYLARMTSGTRRLAGEAASVKLRLLR
ncbi:MAG: hypothetical protein QUU85_19020, partial [Candidatus Eisenbacteria bacterium]|nr:hypothetical protein [Candidatus Eisenbacteria bacterium]